MDHLIFAYGTLKDPRIRKEVTGRDIEAKEDIIAGFCMDKIILDCIEYPILTPCTTLKNSVQGVVFTVNDNELKDIDKYESDAYQRIKVRLTSGIDAWVYVKP